MSDISYQHMKKQTYELCYTLYIIKQLMLFASYISSDFVAKLSVLWEK